MTQDTDVVAIQKIPADALAASVWLTQHFACIPQVTEAKVDCADGEGDRSGVLEPPCVCHHGGPGFGSEGKV